MSRRIFDRYMVALGMGRNDKLACLTDSEFRAHIVGVLAIAAKSPVRGYLLIAEGCEATAEHIANQAGGKVTKRIAESAITKLADVGILERDDEMDAWRVHDFDELNPAPKQDTTAAERQRRHRGKVEKRQKNQKTFPENGGVLDIGPRNISAISAIPTAPINTEDALPVTPNVTPLSRRDNRDGHAPVTGGEVEVEVEGESLNRDLPTYLRAVGEP